MDTISPSINEAKMMSTVDGNKILVKESMTRAFKELHAGQAKSDARKLFAE